MPYKRGSLAPTNSEVEGSLNRFSYKVSPLDFDLCLFMLEGNRKCKTGKSHALEVVVQLALTLNGDI